METDKGRSVPAPKTAKNIKVVVKGNTLSGLKELSQWMPSEVHDRFEAKYGKIVDLLYIPVETSSLSALAQYWNPSLRCFEFPQMDLTPTIEEYACMLKLPVEKGTRVYQYNGHYVSDARIARMMGVEVNQLRGSISKRGETSGLARPYIEDHLRALIREARWADFGKVLALAVYGLVLFPSAFDLIDYAAMDVFFMFETHRANPIPAILADTFLSLNYCHERKGNRLLGCTHLLYVWIATHLYATPYLNRAPGTPLLDPLRDFNRIPEPKMGMYEWLEKFENLKNGMIKWVCPWYSGQEVIYCCGEFPNVPLMGPKGCIAYTPALVLSQLQWLQTIPQKEQLGGICFYYRDDEEVWKMHREVVKAWGDIIVYGKEQLRKRAVIAANGYFAWREERRNNNVTPSPVLKVNKDNPAQTQLKVQLEAMKSSAEIMDQEKQVVEGQLENLQVKYQALKKEMGTLKRRNNEAGQVRMGQEKLKMKLGVANKKLHTLATTLRNQGQTLESTLKEKAVLEAEAQTQGQTCNQLKGEVDELKARLGQLSCESSHGQALVKELTTRLNEVELMEAKWKTCAQDMEMENDYWREGFVQVISEANSRFADFIHHFKRANAVLTTPPEMVGFMEVCRELIEKLKGVTNVPI